MGHLRQVRNSMFNRGNSIRGIRATTVIDVVCNFYNDIRRVTVRVRNMARIGVGASEPLKSPKTLRQYGKALRKRYKRVRRTV